MKYVWFLSVVPLAAFAACSADDDGLRKGDGKSVPPLDHAPVEVRSETATPRRLSTDQWRGSFPTIFGTDTAGAPITWKSGTSEPLESAGIKRALGEPDYITTTEEALEPSILYAKFTDDAARSVCGQALDADSARADAKTRVVVRFASPADSVESNVQAIDANLRYLKLRFHAVHVPDTETSLLAPLRDLFRTVSTGTTGSAEVKAKSGWMAVCVALSTSPEFHIY
jgi:hypothetical protein